MSWLFAKKAPPTGASRFLTAVDFQRIEQETGFEALEVEHLHTLFYPHMVARADEAGNDASTAELKALCESSSIAVHPLIRRVLLLMNADKSGHITFFEYCLAMRALSVRSTMPTRAPTDQIHLSVVHGCLPPPPPQATESSRQAC